MLTTLQEGAEEAAAQVLGLAHEVVLPRLKKVALSYVSTHVCVLLVHMVMVCTMPCTSGRYCVRRHVSGLLYQAHLMCSPLVLKLRFTAHTRAHGF